MVERALVLEKLEKKNNNSVALEDYSSSRRGRYKAIGSGGGWGVVKGLGLSMSRSARSNARTPHDKDKRKRSNNGKAKAFQSLSST